MKKVFDFKKVVAIFVVSTMFACTQDINNEFAQVENEQEESITMKALPKRRTYAEALTIAQAASDLDFGVSNDYNYNFNIGLKMIPNICPANN